MISGLPSRINFPARLLELAIALNPNRSCPRHLPASLLLFAAAYAIFSVFASHFHYTATHAKINQIQKFPERQIFTLHFFKLAQTVIFVYIFHFLFLVLFGQANYNMF